MDAPKGPQVNRSGRLRRALGYAAPYRRSVIFILLVTLVIAGLNAGEPLVLNYIFDGLQARTPEALGIGIALLIGVSVVREWPRRTRVGPSGSGKTTMMAMVMRFYDPQEGAIRLDETDLRGLKQRSLRRNIGTVLQDPLLFNDTVRNNIAYGRPEASWRRSKRPPTRRTRRSSSRGCRRGARQLLGNAGAGCRWGNGSGSRLRGRC